MSKSRSQRKALQTSHAREFRVLLAIIAAGILAALNYDRLRGAAYWVLNVRGYVKSPDQDRLLLGKGMMFRECRDCPDMIFVHRGVFERGGPLSGSPDPNRKSPISKVEIRRSFAVSETEITFAQWDACSAYGPCRSNISAGEWGRGQQPLIYVSWEDAQVYVGWISALTGRRYRLLSEAEWEFAARGGEIIELRLPGFSRSTSTLGTKGTPRVCLILSGHGKPTRTGSRI